MLRRVAIFILLLIAVMVSAVGYLGYQFYITGDDYGHVAENPDDATIRTIKQGNVIGFLDQTGTHTWLGIPYAAPPVGDLRWRSPQEPASWESHFPATQASDYCKQIASFGESRPPQDIGKPIGAEDCLYLNVFVPSYAPDEIPAGSQRRPVMVYIHGGGNTAGYANQYKYSGRHLAQHHDVVVVTFNYRLGPFGWFSHPALNKGGPATDRSGNFGLLDAIEALTWVQANIASFGGDPSNVTLFGESAGGMNVFALLASALSDNLFHKAIVQSGLPISMPLAVGQNYSSAAMPGHANSGREVTNKFLIEDGRASNREEAMRIQNQMTDAQLGAYLREQDAENFLLKYSDGNIMAVPMLFEDGTVLPFGDLTNALTEALQVKDIPMIMGTNRDEFKLMFLGEPEFVEFKYGFLPRLKSRDHFNAVTGYFNDAWKARGVDEVAISAGQTRNNRLYAYRFDWDKLPTILGTDLSELLGAAHAAEIPFVFRSFRDSFTDRLMSDAATIKDRNALSAHMSSYWAEFAYSGTPGRGRKNDLVPWHSWKQEEGLTSMVFSGANDNHMITDEVTLASLKQRLLADERFPDKASHSGIYDCLFRDTDHFEDSEFQALGGATCQYPMFDFLRL